MSSNTSKTSLEPLGGVLTAYQGVDTKEDNKEPTEALQPPKRTSKK